MFLSAVLVCASSALFAQAPSREAPPQRGFDKAAREKARQACEGTKGAEQRDCMRREMCAQTKDPAKCEARIKERAAQRAKIREACSGKQGEELRNCIREQRQKK